MRKKVIEIYQSGKGYKAISKALRLPQTTVRAIIYKWRKHGTVENLPRSGRPTKITPRAQQQLIQEVTKDPTTTSKELQASLASVKELKGKTDADAIKHGLLSYRQADNSTMKGKLKVSKQARVRQGSNCINKVQITKDDPTLFKNLTVNENRNLNRRLGHAFDPKSVFFMLCSLGDVRQSYWIGRAELLCTGLVSVPD
ncbi:hypothetical protein QTP70_009145 [Hemibagrus guttatus]|uniref:Sleeping Beauty transposase HTH domain-containing protein n=1 Tax=Hemibagrus guttatus TaxID=175788 RepID=A0AAE0UM88_9TELE|nr:hypothetical protein QTP70_009145 [Hemibagrus guttatus]